MMNKEALLSRIAEAEAQLEEMRKELNKKEVWEPEDGDWYISGDGFLSTTASRSSSKRFGTERKTKEAAEKARDEMSVYHRLLAYRDEFAPDYEPDWRNAEESKFYIYNNGFSWEYNLFTIYNVAGCVYMPKDVADELCRKLNSGEVTL